MSAANDIAKAIATRLATIRTAAGYASEMGARVLRGRKRLDASHLPCAVIVEMGVEILDQRTGAVKVAHKMALEGHSACDANNPNDTGHDLIADIKKAVFSEKLTYGDDLKAIAVKYVGHSIAPREDGLEVVSALVEITVEYFENLANP